MGTVRRTIRKGVKRAAAPLFNYVNRQMTGLDERWQRRLDGFENRLLNRPEVAEAAYTRELSAIHERLDQLLRSPRFESRAVDRALAHAHLLSRQLVFIDVGCRWGLAERWLALGDLVRVFGFDADEAECERLQQGVDPAAIRYVPVALGASKGRRELFLTRDPGSSSLYPPDDDVIDAFPEMEMIRKVGTTEVDVTTFDDWATTQNVRPDVFKIDVQGAELDVLRGAERSLASVRALEIEVEFNAIYRGQPLFADIDRFLRERNFVLWHLGHLVHYGQGGMAACDFPAIHFFDSRPLEFKRSGGQLWWGHAYFVQRDVAQAQGSREQLSADALVAASLGLDDLAYHLLANIDSNNHASVENASQEPKGPHRKA
jgi:FkbM family methyltransferase